MSSLRDKRSSKIKGAEPPVAVQPAEVMIGHIVSVTEDGAPVVDFPGNPAGGPVRVLATARYGDVPPGASVALIFLEGDRARPLVLGVIAQQEQATAGAPAPVERLTLSAAREIVLQCGHASIVLTRAGKVLVRGAYVSLRSSGMQRIAGATVHIN